MDKLFPTVLSMSITGAFVIVAVILARLPLKKAPKIISYCLWAVVGFRLICPFTLESVFSFIPFETQQIPGTRLLDENISFPATMGAVNQAIGDIANGGLGIIRITTGQEPDGTRIITQALHHEYWLLFFSKIWVPSVFLMLLYGIISYVLLIRRMRTAIRVEGNIYETDNIQSPFVLGIIKPKIYLPLSLVAGECGYIILHERTHIRRHDHIIKFVAYFILCLHWFNPLAWAAFLLMCVDMEMSCDERVLKEMGDDTKHDYSRSLLSLATERRIIGGSPLAFGEGGVKERVKNVLNFKKPSRVIMFTAVVLVAVLSIGLVMNRAAENIIINSPETAELKNAHPDTMGTESVKSEVMTLFSDMRNSSEYMYMQDGVFENEKSTITYPSILIDEKVFNQLLSLLSEYEWRANRALSSFSASDFVLFVEIYTRDMERIITLYGGYDLILYQDKANDIPMYFTYIPSKDMASADLAERLKVLIDNNAETARKPEPLNQIPSEDIYELIRRVENSLSIIMSSPLTSSNPQDYINAHI